MKAWEHAPANEDGRPSPLRPSCAQCGPLHGLIIHLFIVSLLLGAPCVQCGSVWMSLRKAGHRPFRIGLTAKLKASKASPVLVLCGVTQTTKGKGPLITINLNTGTNLRAEGCSTELAHSMRLSQVISLTSVRLSTSAHTRVTFFIISAGKSHHSSAPWVGKIRLLVTQFP
jgi:hypothetical protein